MCAIELGCNGRCEGSCQANGKRRGCCSGRRAALPSWTIIHPIQLKTVTLLAVFFDAINMGNYFSSSIVRAAIKTWHSKRIYKNVTQCHPRCPSRCPSRCHPRFQLRNCLMKTVLKTDKNYANNLKHKRKKKITLSISLAILFAVPFAVSFLKQNLQTEKYKYQG